jgi:hypothetical protein
MSLTFPVDAKLKDGSSVQLVLADNQDIEPLRRLYRVIVEEGTSYPHDRFPDEDAFMDYWFRGKSTVRHMCQIVLMRLAWSGRSTSSRTGLGGRDKWRTPASSSRQTGATKAWGGCWAPRC